MKLIDISGRKFMSKASVPAGKAAVVDLGTVDIAQGIEQPTGETSKTEVPMPKYKTIPGMKQGVPHAGPRPKAPC